MPLQQLIISLVFILLGGVLGWLSHSAYIRVNEPQQAAIKSVKTPQQAIVSTTPVAPEPGHLNTPSQTSNESESNNDELRFSELMSARQYEQALMLFKENHQSEVFQSTLKQVVENLKQQNNWQSLKSLLTVFLSEYYNNIGLLTEKARLLSITEEYDGAIVSFYLAKNYAQNEDDFKRIQILIYDFSQTLYQHFNKTKDWKKGALIFEQFIENEPQYAFYHLALAHFYNQLNDEGKAIVHLQLITDDPIYGARASEQLQDLYLNDTHNEISLSQHNSHYIVNASIAGIYQVKLMIDTGASLSILSPQLMYQLVQDGLAIKMGKNQLYTAGGVVEAELYKISSIALGEFSVKNITTAELELEITELNPVPVDGLLGMSFLKQFNFSIDQENQKLLLYPK